MDNECRITVTKQMPLNDLQIMLDCVFNGVHRSIFIDTSHTSIYTAVFERLKVYREKVYRLLGFNGIYLYHSLLADVHLIVAERVLYVAQNPPIPLNIVHNIAQNPPIPLNIVHNIAYNQPPPQPTMNIVYPNQPPVMDRQPPPLPLATAAGTTDQDILDTLSDFVKLNRLGGDNIEQKKRLLNRLDHKLNE